MHSVISFWILITGLLHFATCQGHLPAPWDPDPVCPKEKICSPQATCQFDDGFQLFVCTCNAGYVGNGINCTIDEAVPTCPVLPNPENGHVISIDRTEGSIAYFKCNEGYMLNGPDQVHCESDLQWDELSPSCEVVTCAPPEEFSNGRIDNRREIYHVGDNVTFVCNIGVKIRVSTCLKNGQWSSRPPRCKGSICKIPSDPANGKALFSSREQNSELRYECNFGFRLSSSQTRICGSDREWTGDEPTCIAVSGTSCKIPSDPANGTAIFTSREQDSELRYKCNLGFRISSNQTRICGSDGKWTGDEPTCIAVSGTNCKVPKDPVNGRAIFTSREMDSELRYKCNFGFRLSSSQTRICGSDGKWSGDEPTCIGINCKIPSDPVNGNALFASLEQNSELTYECNPGFKLSSSQIRICGSDGEWTGDEPTCIGITCFPPTEIDNGRVIYHSLNFNSELAYECNTGFQLHATSEPRKCGSNSKWTGQKPSCRVVRCARPSDPENGKAIYTSLVYGSELTYECIAGLHLTYDEPRTCGPDGEWTGDKPACRVIKCQTPSDPGNGTAIYTSLEYDSELTYDCNPGFHLSSNSQRRCGPDGKWTGVDPICTDGKCGTPHQVDRARISNPSDSDYVLGSIVTYKCDHGFISGGALRESRCVEHPETKIPYWTPPEVICNPRSCGDPGSVANARRNGSRFTFPNSVEFICNEGYRLSGLPKRYCGATGLWSGRLPTCNIISCRRPSDIENGRAIYVSLEYDSELRYECNQGLQLSSNEPRLCEADGEWTGEEPFCKAIECEVPKKPDFGSVDLVGNKRTIDSIVIYKCQPGKKMVGMANSKCIKVGQHAEWRSPAPRCVEPCPVPSVSNGDLGKYEDEFQRRRGWMKVFKRVPFGTKLDENEEVRLQCKEGYVPKGQQVQEITITCVNGKLSPAPECVTTSCLDDPPSTPGGTPDARHRRNGSIIWYYCDVGFEKVKDGNVTCVYGHWTGIPPVCEDMRCHKETLNYTGLVRQEGFVYNRQSFQPKCSQGYEITDSSNTRIFCANGEWIVKLQPCTPVRCRTDSLSSPGFVSHGDKAIEEGVSFQPTCAEGYGFSNKNDSKVYCRGGEWTGNLPPCIPAHCSSDPSFPDNGKIKSRVEWVHGSKVEYDCDNFFALEGENTVICEYGRWIGTPPTCKDTRIQPEVALPPVNVEINTKQPITDYTTQVPQLNSNTGENVNADRNVLLLTTAYHSTDVPQVDGSYSITAEANGDESVISSSTVNPPCSCMYIVNDQNLVGHDGHKRLQFGDEVPCGSNITFHCSLPGFYIFRGPVSLTCPESGEWHSSEFASCIYPPDHHIRIRVFAFPEENISVGPGNVISVVPGTELRLECAITAPRQSESLSFSIPGYFTGKAEDSTTDIYKFYILPKFSQDNVGTYKCYSNYGALRSITIEVRVVQCPEIRKTEGLTIHYNNRNRYSGSTATFRCISPYRRNGPMVVTCQESGTWTQPPASCSYVQCPEIEKTDGLVIQYEKTRSVGSIAILRCSLGYVRRGPHYVTCLSSLLWSEPSASCSYIQCPEIIETEGLTVSYSNPRRNPGTQASFQCSPNYLRSRSSIYSVTCQASGQWSGAAMSCYYIQCPEIIETEGLTVLYTSPTRNPGTQATFECSLNYIRSGPSTYFVTCQASGRWSGSPISCHLPSCSVSSLKYAVPTGIVPLIDEGTKRVPFGHAVKLGGCDQVGKAFLGNDTAVCRSGGNWEFGANIKCAEGCSRIEKRNGSELLIAPDQDIYLTGDSVTFSCPAGKRLISKIPIERMLCFQTGWAPPVSSLPDCQ